MTARIWGIEQRVNTTTQEAQNQPAVVALADGGFVIVWQDDSPAGALSAVRFQRYDALGNRVGGEQTVLPGASDVRDTDAVALPNGGFAVAVTRVLSATDRDPWVVQFDAAGNATNTTVNGAVDLTDDPAVAVNGTGIVVAWIDLDSNSGDIFAQRVDSAGAPVGAFFQVNLTTAGAQGLPEATQLTNGRLAFTWRDNNNIYVRTFDAAGANPSAEVVLPVNAFFPMSQITALRNGGFVVAYGIDSGFPDAFTSVRAVIFNSSGAQVTGEFRLNSSTNGSPDHPQITATADGGFAAVWFAGSSGVKGSVFDSFGNRVGDEFTVSTTPWPGGFVNDLSVAELNDGRLVVTWATQTPDYGDTSGASVTMQIIDPRNGAITGQDRFGAEGDTMYGHRVGDDVMNGKKGNDSLFGLGGNDALYGSTGNDLLSGGAGADFLDGASGNDRLLGGDGEDTAAFRATLAEAQVIRLAHGSYRVTTVGAVGEGVDIVRGAEKLQFADRTIDIIGYAHDDLNGDGVSDVLVRSASTGTLLRLDMADGFQSGGGTVGAPASNVWRAQATGDINRDGIADIVFKNTSSGQFYIWTVQNGQQTGGGDLGVIGATWDVITTGDYNTDGIADLLWRNSANGDLYVWTMNASLTLAATTHLGTLGTNWTAGPSGDLNGDGSSDVLLRNSSDGRLYAYLMSGGVKTGEIDFGSLGANWFIAGVGDFNGDAFSDIALRNSATDQVYLYLMKEGGTWTGSNLGVVAGAAWQIAGTGDYDGDSTDDILWHNSVTGEAYLWTMADGVQAAFTSHSLGLLSTDLAII